MHQHASATVDLNGAPRRVEATVDLLTDRATILVDGNEAKSTLVRRPFSSLFRYRFQIDATPWEVRVSPNGLRTFEVVIVPASQVAAPTGLSTSPIAAASGLPGVVAAVGLSAAGVMPFGPSVALGAFVGLGTFVILWLVYGRRSPK
jgi:hypothetical protein